MLEHQRLSLADRIKSVSPAAPLPSSFDPRQVALRPTLSGWFAFVGNTSPGCDVAENYCFSVSALRRQTFSATWLAAQKTPAMQPLCYIDAQVLRVKDPAAGCRKAVAASLVVMPVARMVVNAGTDRRVNNRYTLEIEPATDIIGLPFVTFLGQYPDGGEGGRSARILLDIESHPHPFFQRVGGRLEPTVGIHLDPVGQFERLVVDDQLVALKVKLLDLAVFFRRGKDLAGRGAGCELGPY